MVEGSHENNSNKNSLRNSHQWTSREETKEIQISVGGEVQKVLHQEDQKSLPSDFEKYEETSHENEKESLETIEYNSEIHSTMDMDQRESIDRCLNCEGVPTNGCSQLCVGDIEIRFQNFSARKISHKHEYEDLVIDNE